MSPRRGQPAGCSATRARCNGQPAGHPRSPSERTPRDRAGTAARWPWDGLTSPPRAPASACKLHRAGSLAEGDLSLALGLTRAGPPRLRRKALPPVSAACDRYRAHRLATEIRRSAGSPSGLTCPHRVCRLSHGWGCISRGRHHPLNQRLGWPQVGGLLGNC